MDPVTVDAQPLTIEDLLAAVEGAELRLGEAARARIAAGRVLIDEAIASGIPVYGLSTNVGHGKDQRVRREELQRQQRMLVDTHGGAFGPPLAQDVVRAAIVVRINGMARGGSGASLAAAGTLVSMLNAGVHPVLPGTGSIGAADIGHMAGIAQVAVGAGLARYDGVTLPGGEALRRAGIPPLRLEGKDGLALISSNGVSVGHGAIVTAHAARVADAADEAAALSLEATGGNPSIVLPAVGRAKPYPGQIAAAVHLLGLLQGSRLLDAAGPRSVQDALSFRVVPQVHGALREFLAATRRSVEVELNSASDNPLADVTSGTMISNGNFHPIVMAVSFDALRVALVHVGQLSERRMSHLWDAVMGSLERGTPPPAMGPASLPGVQLRYAASACFTALRLLAAPATLNSTVLDLGVEDHATGAVLGVRKTEEALGLLSDLLAIEVLLAVDVLDLSSPTRLGSGTARVAALVHAAAAGAASAADVHHRVREQYPAPSRQ
ncbi:aromatic amino acid ammonia-lyase [Arthrobacter sp. SX1312]|uniref:aromatic amino acid ammonia-lyase n=1 Tax=Arthrobacter sp. SX1312 TaxID=2058896 RepID=UPI0015E1E96D|nr:aromatic amino acid ammonia-lyase [Arthrobacter sp. SX1312]